MKTITFNHDQVNGVAHIYAIPSHAVREITYNPLNGLHRLSLLSADEIIVLPVYSPESTTFDEQQQTEEAVDTYNVTISVYIPRHVNPLITSTLEKGQWLVLHQDANGDILLSGTTDIPLTFQTHRTTSADSPSGNYAEFTAVEPTPSLHIDPRAFYI